MNAKTTWQGIMSLSAASVALLQSATTTEGKPPQEIAFGLKGADESLISKTENLVLAPSHQEELLRLYAGHQSHASHASHASHYSGAGSTVPLIPAPAPTPRTPPSTYPTYPSHSQPQARPVAPVTKTTPVVQTNTPSTTTSNLVSRSSVTTTNEIDWLKKRSAEGSAEAQFALGIYYLHGRPGVAQNVEKGKLLLELSAIQGNEFAKKRLEDLEKTEKEKVTPEKP